MVATRGFPVEEITGGCFCCRFDSLVDATCRLTEDVAPQVFIAEPVGSCTDLRASVSYPLQRMYGDAFVVAPLSVLIDPIRALRGPGCGIGRLVLREGALPAIDKQLEEAAILVINKCDVVEPARIAALRAALEREFPRAQIFVVSARYGTGPRRVVRGDRARRRGRRPDAPTRIWRSTTPSTAKAKPLLGWLNASVRLDGGPFDGNAWLRDLAARRSGAARRARHRDRASEGDLVARRQGRPRRA